MADEGAISCNGFGGTDYQIIRYLKRHLKNHWRLETQQGV